MTRKWLAKSTVLLLALASPAHAQNSTISNLPAASTPLTGAEQLYCTQGGADKKCTSDQISALAPTLPAAKSLCLMGDSFVADSDHTGTLQKATAETTGAFGTWLNVYTAWRVFRSPGTNNFGVSGATTSAILSTQLPQVLASSCDVVVVEGGTNDVNGDPCTTITNNLKAIYSTLVAAGKIVIRPTIIPRGAPATYNATQTGVALCVNRWDRQVATGLYGSRGFYLVDLDPTMTDPSQATWSILSASLLQSDGVHPSTSGASIYAAAVAAVINQLVPSWLQPMLTASDTYDATNNPRGNLFPNGTMAGTGGTFAGGGACAGSAPNSTTVESPTWLSGGGTCAVSVQALANGTRAAQVVLGGTLGTVATVDLFQTPATPSDFAAGDTIQGLVWISMGANTNIGTTNAFLEVDNPDSGFYHTFQRGSSYALPSGGFAPTVSFSGANWVPLFTQKVHGVGTTTGMRMTLRLQNSAAGGVSATIQTCCWELRKVIP